MTNSTVNYKQVFILCLIVTIVGVVMITFNNDGFTNLFNRSKRRWLPKLANTSDFDYVEKNGRRADDGVWFEQSTPFRLVVFSAFYDNRLSLGNSGPRLVIIVQSARKLDCCVAWYGTGKTETSEVLGAFELGPSLVGCQIPVNANRSSSIPTSMSFCWKTSSSPDGAQQKTLIQNTTFRVPVTSVGKTSVRTGKRLEPAEDIVLCLAGIHGNVDAHTIVEWVEMNFILGVKRVLIYNHAARADTVQFLQKYANLPDSNIELRHSTSSIIDPHRYGHQDPTLYDCLYRHAGLFRYVGIWDFDELIVPKQPGMKLLDVVKMPAGNADFRVGAFEFRNVYFHMEYPPMPWNVSVSGSSTLSADLYPLPKSVFLSRRQRGYIWPRRYVTKNIMTTDACVVPWTHGCKVWTPAYAAESSTTIRELDVSPLIATKHHYRFCHLSVGGGDCGVDRSVSRPDDIMLRYAEELTRRIKKTYKRLNLNAPT